MTPTANVRRGSLLLLSLALLCMLILYAGQDAKRVRQLIGLVESRRLGAEEGGRADKRQFQFINRVVTSFDKEAEAAMAQLVARKAPSRDPQMIEVVRRMIDPPPNEGLKMLSKAKILETPQSKEVDALLKKQTKGFFVECGAFDGEAFSNSLPFEYSRDWTGLLIEVSPYYYTQLLGKNRNVWSLNACLSPYSYATQLQFEVNTGGQLGRVKMLTNDLKPTSSVDKNTTISYAVPCFPLETILIALNQTRIDFFSLDVEGLELEVLKTIPFDRINIQVLAVEYLHGKGGKAAYKSFMESKGFRTYKDLKFYQPSTDIFARDYIFINNGSSMN